MRVYDKTVHTETMMTMATTTKKGRKMAINNETDDLKNRREKEKHKQLDTDTGTKTSSFQRKEKPHLPHQKQYQRVSVCFFFSTPAPYVH